MATIQGKIKIVDYKARVEQAITRPERNPSYVLSLNGIAKRGSIDHALFYFDAPGHGKYGQGDVSPNHRIRAFLSYDDYSVIIDLLRNETPVYVIYSYQSDDSRLEYYSVTTEDEPVGENE